MEDQEKDNQIDVITVDVPLFIRLLEFAREDATDDMKLHDVASKLIEMCADGDIMTMEQYDEIVGSENQIDTSNMNAVEDDMQNKNKMNEININRWAKLAGINENEVNEGGSSFTRGDHVYVVRGEETESGEVIGSDSEGVTVALDNGDTVKVSPNSILSSSDYFINENEVKIEESKKGVEKVLNIAFSLPDDANLDDLETALRENGIKNAGIVGVNPPMLAYPYLTPDLYVVEFTNEADKKRIEGKGYKKINNTLYY